MLNGLISNFLSLKKLLPLFGLVLLLFLQGCSGSKIAIDIKRDDAPFDLCGNDPERQYDISADPIDSLVSLFDLDGYGSSLASAPLVYAGYIFCPDLGGRLYCYSLATHKKAGMLKYKGSIAASPVFVKDLIAVPVILSGSTSTDLIYYDFMSGKEMVRRTIKGYVINDLLKCADGIVAVAENGIVEKFSFKGEPIFHSELKAFVHGSPALLEDKIYIPSDDGSVYVLNSSTGASIEVFKTGEIRLYGLSVRNGKVFIPAENGIVLSMDAHSGKIVWRQKLDGAVRNSISSDSGTAYIGTSKGMVYALSLDSGTVLWECRSGGVVSCPLLVTKFNILTGNQNGEFLVMNKKSGEIISKYKFENRVRTIPALYGEWIVVGYDYGEYRVFKRNK